MLKLQGYAVSPGVAIGEALILDKEGFRIPRRFVARDAIESELDRFDRAIARASEETAHSRDAVGRELGSQYGAIFEVHQQLLQDPKLRDEVEMLVRQRHYSPEYAVSRVLRKFAKVFESLNSTYLAERSQDIFDIEKQLLRHLLGNHREELRNLTSPVLVAAYNLMPSETASMNRQFVRGFVTEIGGPSSHTAIVAGALKIPAVVGVGPFLNEISGGDLLIIDGNHGEVILHPDEETLARYRHEAEVDQAMAVELASLRDLPAVTSDGVRIQLLGNIEFPDEVDHCSERGADGIGLYRTEFLYLTSDIEPTEETHFAAYRRVVEAMKGRPVVIRTLDLGADKALGGVQRHERNPDLGLRSIRLSLRNLPLFRTQLRAILRASTLGDVRVMFPMISTVLELRQAKMVLADVMEDLEEQGIDFRRDLPVGMMVEVPSAVVVIDRFVPEVDFFSIGTNDLVQYTLAVDRDNKDVASLYNAADPAVVQLIQTTVQAAKAGDVAVNVCGQMSSSPLYTMLLLGVGLRQLSVTPSSIPEIKKLIRHVSMAQCQTVAEHVRSLDGPRDIKRYLQEEVKRILPELAIL